MTMIELRPPTDADNYRVKAGRFGDRFYTDPLPADGVWDATGDDDIYPSVSTVKKATGQDWSKAMAKRLSKAPQQLIEIGNIDDEFERKARLNLLSDAGLNQAGERGTIVHAHAEAMLANRLPMYQMSDVAKPYVRTLDAFLAAYNPTLVAVEFVAIHRTLNSHGVIRGNEYLGYGGTGDAVISIDGKLYLVDWKSRPPDSDHKAYAEEGAQVSAYGRADYWIVHDPESPHGAKRIEPPDLAGGLIVSIKPDSYECFPIDLDEGFAYWTDLHAWWQARRSETRSVGRKWAPRAVPEQAASQLAPEPSDGHVQPPTPASNRARFDALPEVAKGWAREAFKRKGIDPRNAATAGEVSRIIGEMEQRPSLREMQETKAAQEAAHAPVADTPTYFDEDSEGGPAPEALIAEARLMFDMVLDKAGREWTGRRVKEANVGGVSFRMSELASMKRAYIYLALCRWAAWRQERGTLETDEAEGNIEFACLIGTIYSDHGSDLPLGHRLGNLTAEQAEELAAEIESVVRSETDGNLAIQTETQPASEPASA